MTIFSKNLNDLYDDYKSWVCRNRDKVTYFESFSGAILNILEGSVCRSRVPKVWINSTIRLLSLFNAYLIHSSNSDVINTDKSSDKLKIFLTILEHTEVPLECTAQSLWREKGKWKSVAFLQCLKLLIKLMLILLYKEKFVYSCSDNNLKLNEKAYNSLTNAQGELSNNYIILKRSGRIIRKVHSAPPIYGRFWTPPIPDIPVLADFNKPDTIQLIGELVYTVSPILNLGMTMKYGYGTWRPWITSLLMDLISIYLINNPSSKKNALKRVPCLEHGEMNRRYIRLLLYFLRSPFYERHMRDKLRGLLSIIPILGQEYIQELEYYLQIYSYIWSK